MGPNTFKGRPITETNVQECISSIVSKYMSPDFPPWQIKIIPLANENSFYMLIRIHHLILDEQKNLLVCDMMLLDRSRGMKMSSQILSDDQKQLMKSPLANMIKKPKNLMAIYDDISDAIIDRWNSFVHKHDSLDHHDGLAKKPINLTEYLASVVMMILNTQLDYKHNVAKTLRKSSDPQLHFKFWLSLMIKEHERRQLSVKLFVSIILSTINPINISIEVAKFLWWTIITWTFLMPWYVWREIEAIYRYIFLNRNVQANCLTGFVVNYVPLVVGSVNEIFYFIGIILNGPRLFIEEAFRENKPTSHSLQSSALCGRKVVSWSKEIPCDELKSKSQKNQLTHSEILLSTVSSCLMKLFSETNEVAPSHVRVNFRSIPYAYLFGTKPKRHGVLGLKLTVEAPSVKQLFNIRLEIQTTRKQQIVTYLMSMIQMNFDFLTTVFPSIWLKVIINFLSKKFSITVTEVMGMNRPEPAEYFTRWNAEIMDVLYFRTPQANTSTAITIQRFKNNIRMCLMCDSNLSEKHDFISSHFQDAFNMVPVLKSSYKM